MSGKENLMDIKSRKKPLLHGGEKPAMGRFIFWRQRQDRHTIDIVVMEQLYLN